MSLEVIRPVIELELKNGCDNQSKEGGFDKFILESIDELFDQPKADRYKTAFSKYSSLTPPDREKLVKHLHTALFLKKSNSTTKQIIHNRLNLDDSVICIHGIGKKTAENLERVGIFTINDALRYIPSRYIDLTEIKKINDLEFGEIATVIVIARDMKVSSRSRRTITAIFSDSTGTIRVTFFNMPWMVEKIKIGNTYTISGNIGNFGGPQITNPILREGIQQGRIETIYPTTKGLSQRTFTKLFSGIFSKIPKLENCVLPKWVRDENKLFSIEKALKEIHKPTSVSSAYIARNRLALEELILLETALLKKRAMFKSKPGIKIKKAENNSKEFLSSLPFSPTDAQIRCVKEITDDLTSGNPMNRLLHGDVGSGKTVVGLAGIHSVISENFQSVWLAPTEVLATQTFKTAKQFLSCEIRYLSGSTKKSERQEINELLQSETPCLLIGTHAILEDWVEIPKLGMIIVDEQHRFGVMQRARLAKKGKLPHVLVMSATPIPRTLAMTLYGDLDVSVVDEMPVGRIPIKTNIYAELTKSIAYKKAVSEIKTGRQVFVVCPLVEESEKISAVSATEMFEKLQNTYFKEFTCSLLHGRMKGSEKNRIMDEFKNGVADVLISTTVIEVGVDVPNATVMIIENAERFGLAQLHQLRGRVGRSSFQSYCFLLPSKLSKSLSILESTNDGLKVAEEDLKIRGPGEIGGTLQSGVPFFHSRLVTPTNLSLLPKAREIAERIVDNDPNLQDKENLKMKEEIKKRFEKRVGMVWVS
jgi:ATP-dependent DNA helicase RecG